MTARLDADLVARGLARSRGHARELVEAGRVEVDGVVARKVAQPVADGSAVTVRPAGPEWVGRAARKLVAAFDLFGPSGWDVAGRSCVDVGASTGGFTQVLLHHGAASVVALDVGHGQLAREVATDPRVTERSGTTVRGVDVAALGGPFDRLVADLSFISLTLVADDLVGLLRDDGEAVVLVKPQFEVGRTRLGRNGLVRRAGDRAQAVTDVAARLAESGLWVRALATSPLTGSTGNVEFLAWLTRDRAVGLPWEAVVRTADLLAANGAP